MTARLSLLAILMAGLVGCGSISAESSCSFQPRDFVDFMYRDNGTQRQVDVYGTRHTGPCKVCKCGQFHDSAAQFSYEKRGGEWRLVHQYRNEEYTDAYVVAKIIAAFEDVRVDLGAKCCVIRGAKP